MITEQQYKDFARTFEHINDYAIKLAKEYICLEHKIVPRNQKHQEDFKSSGVVCLICDFGTSYTSWLLWYCPNSEDHLCKYSKSYDYCDYCGQPEERK